MWIKKLAHQWCGAHPACSKEIDAVCTFNREDTNQMYMYWLYASADDELPIANLAKFGVGKRQLHVDMNESVEIENVN